MKNSRNSSDFYKNSKGINLHIKRDLIKNPKAIILIVHGLCEHLQRYDYVVSKFNEWGYSVYRFDNQGHGRSQGKRAYIEDYNDFTKDVDEMVELIKKENENEKIFILGHSMGGMIGSLYGIDYPNRVDAIILSAGVTVDNAKLMESNMNIDDEDTVPNGLGSLICTDKRVVELYENDPLVCKETTGKIFKECYKAIKYICENMYKFEYPVYILHGKDDKIVYCEDSEILYKNIKSKDKSLKLYDGLYHEILNEFKKDEVLEDIKNWLLARI